MNFKSHKQLTLSTLIAASLMSSAVFAYDDIDQANTFRAKVLEATPVYKNVRVYQPRQDCWNERVHHRGRSNTRTPTIVGGIIGGIIGNQFGRGGGRTAATVAGTALGASIANDAANNDRSGGYTTIEKRCETVRDYVEERELVGYKVKYAYKGDEYWTETRNDPGETIRVRVSVQPLED